MIPPQAKLIAPRRNGELQLQGLGDRIWLAGQMARLDELIRKHGWAPVPFQMPHDRAPRWFYTAGFTETLGQPEMIVFDAPGEIAVEEFQTAFNAFAQGGAPFRDGMIWGEDKGVRSVLREVRPERMEEMGYLALSHERYRKRTGKLEGFRAFQIVLPDQRGLLPWEQGHDADARKWQPQLYEPSFKDGDHRGEPARA